MKNIIRNIVLMGTLASALLLSSCSKQYLDQKPKNALGQDALKGSLINCQGALRGLMSMMASESYHGRNLQVIGDIATDNITTLNSSAGYLRDIEIWNINPSNSEITGVWGTSYQIIAGATNITQACSDMIADPKTKSEDVKSLQNCAAAAYAMKAYAEYILLQYFTLPYETNRLNNQGIIIVPDNQPIPIGLNRNDFAQYISSNLGQCYDDLLANIQRAKTNFNTSGTTDFDNTGSSANAYYPSKAMVYCLEARVNLTMHNYNAAIASADTALNLSSSKSMISDGKALIEAYKSTDINSEDIFTVTQTVSSNLSANSLQTFFAGYGGVASKDVMSLFSGTDIRKALYPSKATGTSPATVLKYPNTTAVINSPVFRLPELYLIQAEAYAKLGDDANCANALFKVMGARDPNIQSTADINLAKKGALLTVLDEDRREFLGEGHRWFDLRRNDLALTRKGSSPGDFRSVFANWPLYNFAYPFPSDETNTGSWPHVPGTNEAIQNEAWTGGIANPELPVDAKTVK